MKRVVSFLIVFTLLFSLAACSSNTNSEESSSPAPQSSDDYDIVVDLSHFLGGLRCRMISNTHFTREFNF